MNKEWSALNSLMQKQIARRDTYKAGIASLFDLRARLAETIASFREELTGDEFCAMPFPGASGFHSKTIAYSLWHIFRIEDIVAHTLLCGDEQIFFKNAYDERIGSSIITTGNELAGRQIADFSKTLDPEELYAYAADVRTSTEKILRGLSHADLKKRIPDERRLLLQSLHVVSDDEKAAWLTDYWCGKDIGGLIRMPFSRHWIMHIEACLRIRNRIRPDIK